MQTILGAGGVIASGLARELTAYTSDIRLVSRHPSPVNPGDKIFAADLMDADAAERAVQGSEVAYLVAGLPYDTAVWESQWPALMRNVLDACKRHGVRLVYFDNVYLYGKVDGPMTESTPVNPVSRKGKVRARLAAMLMDEIGTGGLKGLIGRSADFFGPGAFKTFVHPLVFDKLRQGRQAEWLADASVPHSMTYTPDAARALAVLGNTPDAFDQVWHLPTHADAPTGEQFIRMAADNFGVRPRWKVIKPWMLRAMAPFNPMARETVELLYQYQFPYLFDSSKFVSGFFSATPYHGAIRVTVNSLRWGAPRI